MERRDCSDETGDGDKGGEWRFLSLFYADSLVLCGESLKVMVGHFVEVWGVLEKRFESQCR